MNSRMGKVGLSEATNCPRGTYVSSTDIMIPTHTTGPILNFDGLYSSLPSVLDIQVNPETGRGIYSKVHCKPGE